MEIPKLIVKVETEQQEELVRLNIPADMAGRFLTFVGQQLVNICMPPLSIKQLKHDPPGKIPGISKLATEG